MWSEKRKFGNIGEDTACKFLVKHGFVVIERNFLKKCGEIDIIAKKQGKLRFIEVKTVARDLSENVIRETIKGNDEEYRPEDNIHPAKLKRIAKTIEIYLLEKNVSQETEWGIDVVTVFLDLKNKLAKVKLLEDVII